MIRETVTISAIEDDTLWVESTPKSTCGGCSARSGCGQRILSKLMAKPNRVQVPLPANKRGQLRVGEQVEIGVPEQLIVSGSLLLYMLPLLGLLIVAGVAQLLGWAEWLVALVATVGLLVPTLAVRIFSRGSSRKRFSPELL